MSTTGATPRLALVLETPAPEPEEARHHFLARLAFETDISDLMTDLQKGSTFMASVYVAHFLYVEIHQIFPNESFTSADRSSYGLSQRP